MNHHFLKLCSLFGNQVYNNMQYNYILFNEYANEIFHAFKILVDYIELSFAWIISFQDANQSVLKRSQKTIFANMSFDNQFYGMCRCQPTQKSSYSFRQGSNRTSYHSRSKETNSVITNCSCTNINWTQIT